MRLLVPFLLVFASMWPTQPRQQVPDDEDQRTAAKISALSAGLGARDADRTDRNLPDRYEQLAAGIQSEVDRFVGTRVNRTEASERVQARLRLILRDNRPNLDYADLPVATTASVRMGTGLVIAYELVRGLHNDTATIRGYVWMVDHFALVATVNDDFKGYFMRDSVLKAPVADETWILAWGQAQTFNGQKIRGRVYSFDGQSFRTMWAPEDMLNATINVDDSRAGFSIHQFIETPPYETRLQYVLAANGPLQIR